jgi:hypothetical protein
MRQEYVRRDDLFPKFHARWVVWGEDFRRDEQLIEGWF